MLVHLASFLDFLSLFIALVGDQLMRNLELQSWFFVLCDLWVDEPEMGAASRAGDTAEPEAKD